MSVAIPESGRILPFIRPARKISGFGAKFKDKEVFILETFLEETEEERGFDPFLFDLVTDLRDRGTSRF